MKREEYIKKVEKILKGGLHDIGCYEYSSGNYTQEELEIYNDGLFDQLYQLHLEGVREAEERGFKRGKVFHTIKSQKKRLRMGLCKVCHTPNKGRELCEKHLEMQRIAKAEQREKLKK